MKKPDRRSIKFIQPDSKRLYPRQHLLEQLTGAMQRQQAVWVHAPPGSGKTSLAVLLANAHSGPVVWFHVEPMDRDVQSFIRSLYLATGLKPGVIEPFSSTTQLLQEALQNIVEHRADNVLWVFDGCEVLSDDSAHFEALAELLRDADAPAMLFTSRQPPPPIFSRLLVAQKLATIDWSVMRLSRQEANGVLASLGDFDAVTVDRWYQLSDGWVAALVLFSRNVGQVPQNNTAAAKGVFDYLASEVLASMDPAQQQRLMCLSVLPSIPVSVARDLLDDPSIETHLHKITACWQLVEVSYQNHAPVYRLHPLLKEFMAQRLSVQLAPDALRDLQRKAANSLQKHGFSEDALTLYDAAGDRVELRRLILSRAESLVAEGRLQTLQDWLEKIPRSEDEADPSLDYWMGVCLRFDEPQRGWPLLERAFDGFRARGDVAGQYSAWFALVEAMLVYFEDLKPLRRWLDEYDALRERHPRCPDMALRLKSLSLAGSLMSILSPQHPRLARLIRVAEISVRLLPFRTPRQAAFTYLIMHYANTGQIARMHAMAKHLLPHLEDSPLPGPLRLFAHAMIGLHQIIAGDPAPQNIIATAIKLSDKIGGGHFKSIPRSYLIYYDIIRGDLKAAEKQLGELEKVMRSGHRMEQAAHHFILSWLALAAGDSARGLEVGMLSKEMCVKLGFDFGRALNCSLRAQALAQAGDFALARQELDELAALTGDSGSRLLQVMLGFARSWLALCSKQPQQAAEQLAKTLEIAQQEGIFAYPGMLRPVVTELALLAASQGIAPGYIDRLVERWDLAPAASDQRGIDWPWAVRVTTLGRFEVTLRQADTALDVSRHSRPLELLSAIIACGRNPLPRSLLCDRLWPDTDADKAHHALDNLIYRLRKLIGTQTVRIRNNLISLDESRIWVDAWYLDSLAEQQLSEIPNPLQLSMQLRQVYRGEFLTGQDEYWIQPERDRLLRCYLGIAERIIAALMDRSEYAAIVDFSEHLLTCDPLNESVYLHLMKSLVNQGRQAEAQRVYQRCRDALKHHLQIEPGAAIEAYASSF